MSAYWNHNTQHTIHPMLIHRTKAVLCLRWMQTLRRFQRLCSWRQQTTAEVTDVTMTTMNATEPAIRKTYPWRQSPKPCCPPPPSRHSSATAPTSTSFIVVAWHKTLLSLPVSSGVPRFYGGMGAIASEFGLAPCRPPLSIHYRPISCYIGLVRGYNCSTNRVN